MGPTRLSCAHSEHLAQERDLDGFTSLLLAANLGQLPEQPESTTDVIRNASRSSAVYISPDIGVESHRVRPQGCSCKDSVLLGGASPRQFQSAPERTVCFVPFGCHQQISAVAHRNTQRYKFVSLASVSGCNRQTCNLQDAVSISTLPQHRFASIRDIILSFGLCTQIRLADYLPFAEVSEPIVSTVSHHSV
eukprot:963343-Amphidinium_carterae.1